VLSCRVCCHPLTCVVCVHASAWLLLACGAQEHSCDEVAKVPAGQRCAFVRDKCPSGVSVWGGHACMQAATAAAACVRVCWGELGSVLKPTRSALLCCAVLCCAAESLVPYAQLYFCHVARHNVLVRGIYLVSCWCCCWVAHWERGCALHDTRQSLSLCLPHHPATWLGTVALACAAGRVLPAAAGVLPAG
jgi:hypothetical protein